MPTENTQKRKTVRSRIIEKASHLFFSRGIKVVKMDDIAHELGISKRTVYENFSDKEELLLESLRHINRSMHRAGLERLKQSPRNTLEAILILYYIYFEMLKLANKNFFLDLNKYPCIMEMHKSREKQNRQKFNAWIIKGIKEGVFREDAKSDIIMYILRRDIEYITTSNEFEHYSIDELGRSFILFYLRGIATEKGQAIIEEFIEKQNKKIINNYEH